MIRRERPCGWSGAIALAALLGALGGRPTLAAPQTEVACRGDGARVAMLVGNGDYAAPMQPLDNPKRDVAAFATLLCGHGFTVFRSTDLGIDGFDAAIESFAAASKGARTALVYYSGHGFAAGRQNWLAPTDAKLSCEDVAGEGAVSARMTRRLVDLDRQVFERLDPRADQIVILDACRTNPVSGCRGSASPSLVKGFSRTGGGAGRLVVYATQDGQVALDGIEGSPTSPLMTAMTARLAADPRRDWVTAMLDVSDEVATLTRQRQRPNLDISLRPKGCLAASCEAPKAVGVPPQAVDDGFLAYVGSLTDRAILSSLAAGPSAAVRAAAERRLTSLLPAPGPSQSAPPLLRPLSPVVASRPPEPLAPPARLDLPALPPNLPIPDASASGPGRAKSAALPVPAPAPNQVGPPSALPPPPPDLPLPETLGIQAALLFEDDAANPARPRILSGRVAWTAETPKVGEPTDRMLLAQVDVAAAGLSVALTLERNRDASLPATHLLQVRFTSARSGESARSVREIGLPRLVASETDAGLRMTGVAARVAENVFLIGLTGLHDDPRRSWIELPVQFSSGQRGSFRIEMGRSAERVYAEIARDRGSASSAKRPQTRR